MPLAAMSNSPEIPTPNLGNRSTLCANVAIELFLSQKFKASGWISQSNPRSLDSSILCCETVSFCQRGDPALVSHFDRDLRQLPHLVPLDFLILAVNQLLDQHVAELTAFAFEHEFLGVRFGHIKEAEIRVERQADAFESHDRAHHVCEIRRDRERIFVNHIGQLVGQLSEADFAQFQVQIIREELFDHHSYGVTVNCLGEEVEVDHVLSQPFHIALDDVEEGVNHQALHLRRDAPDHPEIEEGQSPVVHQPQIPRMRIGVEKSVFEELLEIGPRNQLDYGRRIYAAFGQRLYVQDLGSFYELHGQDARADV